MGDTSEEIEGSRLKIYLSLRRYLSAISSKSISKPEVIINVDSSNEGQILEMASENSAITVNVSDVPARLIVETVIQPKLPDIYEEILSFKGNEIYISDTLENLGSATQLSRLLGGRSLIVFQ